MNRRSRAIPLLAGASLFGFGILAMPATSVHAQTTRVSGIEGCGDARAASQCVPEVPLSAAYPVVGGLVLAGYVLYSRRNRHSAAAPQT